MIIDKCKKITTSEIITQTFQSENAQLKANNQTLECELASQHDLYAKMHVLTEDLQKVKEENKKLEQKLTETEHRAEMAKNEVKIWVYLVTRP
jgi:tRNA C32,U32 (ribose-2'-O)-methylase TrmJ